MLQLLGVLFMVGVGAFALDRVRPSPIAVAFAWALVGAQLLIADLVLRNEPPGLRMVGLILTTMLALKGVMLAVRRRDGMRSLGGVARWLFCFAWVGMEPRAFARRGAPRPAGLSAVRQILIVVGGAAAIVLARSLVGFRPFVAGLSLMFGASLILHFTLLRILGGSLRRLGFGVREPFDRPAVSTSLGEFWGRRWNRPFIELGSIAVYRPLQRRFGRPAAVFAMFLVSGLLHEMAISLPVRAGFGGPFGYFVLHGSLVLLEELRTARGGAVGGFGGWLWTLSWLVIPLPILFHEPFVQGVLLPLVQPA